VVIGSGFSTSPLIKGDSGIFRQAGRANSCQNIIHHEKSLKHMHGQSLNITAALELNET